MSGLHHEIVRGTVGCTDRVDDDIVSGHNFGNLHRVEYVGGNDGKVVVRRKRGCAAVSRDRRDLVASVKRLVKYSCGDPAGRAEENDFHVLFPFITHVDYSFAALNGRVGLDVVIMGSPRQYMIRAWDGKSSKIGERNAQTIK